MNWTSDPVLHYAQSDKGYRIDWCQNQHGLFFNAYGPRMKHAKRGKHLDAGYDLTKLKALCEAHAAGTA